MGRIWAICSGSGGVGKTMLALSLAVGASKAGKRTILLDASGPARACDLILGMESVISIDLCDVLSGQCGMEAALYPVRRYEGLRLAVASFGGDLPMAELQGTALVLQSMCDILVVDLPTGQIGVFRDMLTRQDERIFVTRPDDASMRAVERLMNSARAEEAGISLVVNRLRRDCLRRKTQYEAHTVSLTLDCPLLGVIPEDDSLAESTARGRPAIECDGPAWTVLQDITQALLSR